MSTSSHHKPAVYGVEIFENISATNDPAELYESAQLVARTLIDQRGTNLSEDALERIKKLGESEEFEALQKLWKNSNPRTVPGALWRLFAIRATISQSPDRILDLYERGKHSHEYSQLIAGVTPIPSTQEIVDTAESIFSGAFTGDFDIALTRFGSFCRIISSGQLELSYTFEKTDLHRARQLRQKAERLITTANDLEACSKLWADNMLE